MRRIACALVASALAMAGASCGPPPPMMTGSMEYAHNCTPDPMSGSTCQGGTVVYVGGVGEGDPPLLLTCAVGYRPGGTSRFQFTIARGTQSIDTSTGVSACGEFTGNIDSTNGTLVQRSTVDLFFAGSNSRANNTTRCQMQVLEMTTDSVRGRLRCMNAPDNNSPPRQRNVTGIPSRTSLPEWADFNFTTCMTNVRCTVPP